MNLKEAYSTLELEQGSSPDEAKKKYRELIKKFHPDVNKNPDAEDKIKKINEAYQCVQNGKGNDRAPPSHYRQANRNPFGGQVFQLENIETNITIDFKESVMGCKKEVKYSRKSKCSNCDGNGQISLNNGCKKCGGNGRTTVHQQGSVFISVCTECYGKTNMAECNQCDGNGSVHADVNINVTVPAGIINGNILRLQGMGNFAGSFMGMMDQHTDVFCRVSVSQEEGLSISGQDVVSTLQINLLDALKGCNRSVKTIDGNKKIQVKPKSKNKEDIIIPNLGVGGVGNHRVVLDVIYPDNIDKLIKSLADEVV